MPIPHQDCIKSIKSFLRLGYSEEALPVEYIASYFVPEPEILWEIKYHRQFKGKNCIFIPDMLVKLSSKYVDDNKFNYQEIIKIDLQNGHKVRRVRGNLQDFIGKKVYRASNKWQISKFFIKFPRTELEDSQFKDRISTLFGELI